MLGEVMKYDLTLPWPPSINHYYGRRPKGGVYIKAAGKAFRQAVCVMMAARGVNPLQGDLSLLMWVWPPDKRRRDLDNLQKATQDALQHGGAYHDDCQIAEYSVKRMQPVKGGKVVVRISTIPPIGECTI